MPTYADFKAALAKKESGGSGDFKAENSLGYIGRYQFSEILLEDIGFYSKKGSHNNDWKGTWTAAAGVKSKNEFLGLGAYDNKDGHQNAIAAQESAIEKEFILNTNRFMNGGWYVYEGQVLNGHKITLSGMLAHAHLIGYTDFTKSFLASGGVKDPADGNNIKGSEYLDLFSNYTTPLEEKLQLLHAGSEIIRGGAGIDSLRGLKGNDTFYGNGGNDTLDGGADVDTAVFSGKRSEYDLTRQADGSWKVTDKVAGRDGTDLLINMEFAKFSDQSFDLIKGQDIALVIDVSGSMGSSIAEVIASAVDTVEKAFATGANTRISVITFNDVGSIQTVLSFTNHASLEDRKTAAINAIKSISILGGGSEPVNGALLQALNGGAGTWNANASRQIILIGDEAPADPELAQQVELASQDVNVGITIASTSFAANAVVKHSVSINAVSVGGYADAAAAYTEIANQNRGHAVDSAANGIADSIDMLIQGNFIDGTDKAELLKGTSAVEGIWGYGGDDTIYGNAGNDVIHGGDGNDSILSGSSASNLYGDAGNDTLIGGAGNDKLFGGAGDDSLIGGAGADMIDGGEAGNDTLIGGEGNDKLFGGVGEDLLMGGAGADTIDGGDGIDTASYAGSKSAVNINLLNASQSGGDAAGDILISIEKIIGSAGNDTIIGGYANDTIIGGAGADILNGGYNTDTVSYVGSSAGVNVNLTRKTAQSGGDAKGDIISNFENIIGSAHNDSLTGDAGANIIEGGAGADTLNGGDGIDTVSYANSTAVKVNLALKTSQSGGEAAGDILSGFENIIGSSGDDSLTGNALANSILGGLGNDTLIGGAGADTLRGGDGIDTVSYANSASAVQIKLSYSQYYAQVGGDAAGDMIFEFENVIGSSKNDSISGDYYQDNILDGGAGNDTISAEGANNTIIGGAGADKLIGGSGIDTLSYVGSTAVKVNLALSTASGGDAAGDIFSGFENLTGSAGNDSLTGDANANVIIGGKGADTLNGGAGIDTLSYAGSTAVKVNLALSTASGGDATGDVFSGFENVTGSAGNDSLTGDANANVIMGGAGADTLNGGAGIDTVSYINSTAVNVNLALATGQSGGEAAGDILSGFENIIGSSGDDSLTGSSGANSLEGGEGNDLLVGGAGADTLNGGAGIDTASYAGSAAVTVSLMLTTSQSGGDAAGDILTNIENLIGSAKNDSLTGSRSANSIVGGAGNDTIDGGSGADTLVGGDGIDTLSYASSYYEGVSINLALSTASGGDAAGDVFSGFENLTGGSGADTLVGSSGANRIDGGAGNDIIEGGKGADTLIGGSGIDTLSYAGSTAVKVNLALSTASGGDAAGDVFSGFENVVGGVGKDSIIGDAGANIIEGGAGADTLDGGAGIDTVSYAKSTAVKVNLTLTTSQSGGEAAGDILSGFENIIGSSGDDSLTGSSGANSLEGGEGNDLLAGGAGADTLNGGAGIDTVSYANSASAVQVNLGNGAYTAQKGGDAAGDILTSIENIIGSAKNDSLTGDYYSNSIVGGAGNDTIDGGYGYSYDTLVGGDGIDTLSYASYTSSYYGVAINLALSTASGEASGDVFSGFENIIGSSGADTLVGSSDANRIDGGAGNDIIEGGKGADTLIGGSGIDTLSYAGSTAVKVNLALSTASGGDAAGDVISSFENIIGGLGNDSLTGDANANVIMGGKGADTLNGGAGIDTVSYTGSVKAVKVNLALSTASGGDAAGDVISGFENIIGGLGNDSLTGSSGANSLEGGEGNDLLIGGAGADTLSGGAGIDTVSYANSASAVQVKLANGAYTAQTGGDAAGDILLGIENLIGSAKNDSLTGDYYSNSIVGGAGNDTIDGGYGYDTLVGGDGVDTLSYASSTSSYYGVAINLALSTASGGDATGDVFSGFENIIGSNGADTLIGSSGANKLEGGIGNDNLDGGAGNDTLIGGAGLDKLTGGANKDYFVFTDLTHSTDSARDVITDFVHGTDKIDLTGLGFTGLASGAGSGATLGFSVVGGNTIIVDDDSTFSIHLTGNIALTASDFVF